MTGDEPAPSLEPIRGWTPAGSNIAIGVIAFIGGIAGTALVFQFGGMSWRTQPAPVATPTPVAQPAPVQMPAPGIDVATLTVREQALAARLDQLEARIGEADSGARTASGYATQAERLMIAFAARRAIERGLPLGPIEPQMRNRFGGAHREAVGTVIQASRDPVTLEDLRLALDTIAPRLAVAPDDTPWTMFRRAVSDMVVLRQGDSPSPRPADRVSRARRMLDAGQVEAALAEVAHTPGAVSAQSWVSAAKRYIAARTALREIEAAAMETAPAPPPAGA